MSWNKLVLGCCTLFACCTMIAVQAHTGEFHPNGIEGELSEMTSRDERRLRQAASDLGVQTAPGRMLSNWVLSHTITTTPEQLHLSVTPYPGNISVLWVTSTASNNSVVCVRPAGASSSTRAQGRRAAVVAAAAASGNFSCFSGSTWTYNPISVLPWTGNIHGANMLHLVPGMKYEYYVGDANLQVFSNTTWFICPDLYNADKELFIALGGDMGTIQLVGHAVAKQMHDDFTGRFSATPFDAFWLIGDISYSTLDPPKLNFEFFWDMFFRQEQSLVQHVPLLASFGNHDYAGGDAGAYINRFRMPQGGRGLGNFYWSYRHGPIFYISMCTEIGLEKTMCNYAPGSRQYKWLVRQLSTVNRTETPWVILGGHRPMYSSDKATDSGPLQRYIESLILTYKVDVELAGHMHCTEVTAPVANNEANMSGVVQTGPSSWVFNQPSAPVHITAGTLGAVIREKFVDPQPAWSLFRNGTFWDNAYGYVTLKANRTNLDFTFWRTANNEKLWEVSIWK